MQVPSFSTLFSFVSSGHVWFHQSTMYDLFKKTRRIRQKQKTPSAGGSHLVRQHLWRRMDKRPFFWIFSVWNIYSARLKANLAVLWERFEERNWTETWHRQVKISRRIYSEAFEWIGRIPTFEHILSLAAQRFRFLNCHEKHGCRNYLYPQCPCDLLEPNFIVPHG